MGRPLHIPLVFGVCISLRRRYVSYTLFFCHRSTSTAVLKPGAVPLSRKLIVRSRDLLVHGGLNIAVYEARYD